MFFTLQKRVSDRFPNPLGDLAKGFAKEELNKSRRKSTIEFSRDKIHNLLKEVLHGHKVDDQVNLYLVAVLHYIASDILKVRQRKSKKSSKHNNFTFTQFGV